MDKDRAPPITLASQPRLKLRLMDLIADNFGIELM